MILEHQDLARGMLRPQTGRWTCSVAGVSRARPPNRRVRCCDGEPRDYAAPSSRPVDHEIESLLSDLFRNQAPQYARVPSPSIARRALNTTLSSSRSPLRERSFADIDAITGR